MRATGARPQWFNRLLISQAAAGRQADDLRSPDEPPLAPPRPGRNRRAWNDGSEPNLEEVDVRSSEPNRFLTRRRRPLASGLLLSVVCLPSSVFCLLNSSPARPPGP